MLASLLLAAFMSAPRTVEVRLGPVQREIVRTIRRADSRFDDIEGALRSAKTWTILIALRTIVEDYPGIKIAIARWTEGDLNQKLIPDWRNVCALMEITHGVWNAKESCYDFDNGSRVYCVHLKTSQKDNRYSAVRGLTVAIFYIDQLEEVPEDVYNEAALRLSQPGFPQKMIVSPNPVSDSHWIAKRWPTHNRDKSHRYIRVAMRDNKHNLDASTIAAAEALYPVGHPLRKTKIEGMRGLDVRGKPVYSGAYDKVRHVRNIDLLLDLPLYEAYDFGFHHPCVLFYQWAPWGWVRILGGVMGSDLHLDAFLPVVERYRNLWFPTRLRIEATCDPSGANAQGVRGTPVAVLQDWYREHGERNEKGEFVSPVYDTAANMPEHRVAANIRMATYMRRQVNGQEAFLVDPDRWALAGDEAGQPIDKFDGFFLDALEAGYVLEDEARHSGKLGSFYVPRQDGWFEHSMNCLEYGAQAHVLDLPMSDEKSIMAKARHVRKAERDEQIALKKAQMDRDPDDRQRTAMGRHIGRRGGAGIRRRGGY
jgi:hypothetical protein